MITAREAVEVPATPEAVFDVLADVERYPDWQPALSRAEVRERDAHGRPLLVATEHDAGVATIRMVVRFEHEPPARIAWRLVEGDVKALTGLYEIARLGAQASRVTYALEVDPGFRLGLLVRGPVAERVRHRLVDETLEGLRRRVGAG